jgi:hypothetical protein
MASLVGCWLLLGAIVGKLIALSHILRKDVAPQYVYQRVLVAIVGVAFILPGLHTLYKGSTARTVARAAGLRRPPDSAAHSSLQPLSFYDLATHCGMAHC